MPMRCPRCRSVVEPLRDAKGGLLCPVCRNTGTPVAPPSGPAAPPPAGWTAVAAAEAPPVPAPGDKAPGKAVAALALGIAAVVLGPLGLVLGPLAIVFGVQGLRQAKQVQQGKGSGMAVTGIVLGSVGIIVGITVALAIVVFVLVSNLEDDEAWAFDVDGSGAGGTLTVTGYPGFPDWEEFVLEGSASCRAPRGPVGYGDTVVCTTDGDVRLVDAATGEVLYEATV